VRAASTTAFAQYDADVVWTGGAIVVAWCDDSDAASGPDLRVRTFDAQLAPTSAEETLAATPDTEARPALAAFGGGWAAAWRSFSGGRESIRAKHGGVEWRVGPFAPAPAGARPALAPLDATHLALVFTAGADEGGAARVRVAVLDTAAPGDVVARDFAAGALDRGEVDLVRAGS